MAGHGGLRRKWRSFRSFSANQETHRGSAVTVQQLWNRVLAVALAGVPLCAVIWTVAVWLYDAHPLLSAEIIQTRTRLDDYESMLARRPEIEAAVARSRHNGGNYYWAGSTEQGGAEELQRQLLSVIDAAGGVVQEV